MKKLLLLLIFFCYSAHAEPSSLTENLKSLVEINSGSNNTKGVEQIQQWLAQQLKNLHFQVEQTPAHLLIAQLKGQDPKIIITFVMHADTVFEKTSPFQHFKLSEDGKIGYGPGVIDDKGGIVVAVEGLKRYLADTPSHPTLRVVCSPSEEVGSDTFTEKFKAFSKDSFLVLGFEPALENGDIVNSRRGNRWYHIVAEGKEVHSGRDHKNGINACYGLAEKLAKISRLTDYGKNVTVSIGWMGGGQDKYNIMCGHAEAKLDTRFSTFVDRDELHRKILRILNASSESKAKFRFDLANDSPPMPASRAGRPLIQKYVATVGKIEGQPIAAQTSLGSADTNTFSRDGLVIIDGLGPVGGKIHTPNEFVRLSSLETRAEALHQFLRSLDSQK